jgi:hypothetical protein
MEANFSTDELPDGFSSIDPTGAGGSGGAQDAAQAQKLAKEEQRRAILEQALTPEAFARLGTIKVCTIGFEFIIYKYNSYSSNDPYSIESLWEPFFYFHPKTQNSLSMLKNHLQ